MSTVAINRMSPPLMPELISHGKKNRPGFSFSRDAFLHSLRSDGKLDYKRYLGSPLRYAGGKSLAVGLIVEKLPQDIKRLVSPFFGGGSLEIACAKELGIEVIGYDIFEVLVAYWKTQLRTPKLLHENLEKLEPNRAIFGKVKQRLQEYWSSGKKLSQIELATYYYFNSNNSYGPHFLGWPSDVYLEKQRYRKMIGKVRDFRAKNLLVRCAKFEESIPQHGGDFLYCDPPYYLDEGKTFVGMYPHRNFPIHHKGFRHDLLRDMLLKHKGGFILSYNDCPIIRDWYSDCEISTPVWQYTFGQGDVRIGKNRKEQNGGSHVKKSHELLIRKLP